MFQTSRERLTILLIAFLPFHALLVTVATKLIEGPGHAPLTMLALWKEALLGLILCLCFVEWSRSGKWKVESGKFWKIDFIDSLIISLMVLAGLVAIFNFQLSTFNFVLGFKYDFVPLVAFLIARRVEWSEWFRATALKTLLALGAIIAGYGILTFFLPQQWFAWLGYSDLHSLYLPDAPLAAFQQIGGTALRRIQSTMSGPNQLGLWLLIPWSVALTSALQHRPALVRVASLLIAFAIVLTFSRSAWIAAAVITAIVLHWKLPKRKFRIMFGGIAVLAILFAVAAMRFAPQVVLRIPSSSDHIARPLAAMQTMIEHPFGLGLGTAGPASNRVSDACVHLQAGSDPSWAADRPELCVFVGDIQVQPEDPCQCPLLPENWYLQIGVELGMLGFILFIALTLLVLKKLHAPKDSLGRTAFLAFLGISIASLFLHAWEDTAVAYVIFLIAAAVRSCNLVERP